MTEQQPGGVPENFDAFSRPAPAPAAGDTWVDPAYYAPIDPYGIENGPGEPSLPPRPPGLKDRLAGLGKGKLIAGGAVVALLLGGAVWGTSAALASSGSGPSARAPHSPASSAGATGKGTRKGALKTVRLKITSVSADSFVGTDAKGQSVTVAFGDSTHFGTKARPLSPELLAVGMVVTVAGDRSGGSVDATAIVPAKQGAAGSGAASDAPGGPTAGATADATDSADGADGSA